MSLTVDDKLRIAEQLDLLGVHYIEGGWPGANPKDEEFFRRARTELRLDTSTLVAFGSTRRPKGKVDDDPTLRNLVEAGTSTVCIVGKSWDYHVTQALQTDLDEGVAMVADSVEFLGGEGLRVMLDAEHFFDGYKQQPGVRAAGARGGRRCRAPPTSCCATPTAARCRSRWRPSSARSSTTSATTSSSASTSTTTPAAGWPTPSPACGAAPATCRARINGLGERTGNCNLSTIIPNLTLKMGVRHAARRSPGAAHLGEPPHRRAGEPAR